jgi:dTDP-4-dehydrorhamnose reductase
MACERKKVLVLGSTGMLGGMVYKVMEEKFGHKNVIGSIRSVEKVRMERENLFFDPTIPSEVGIQFPYDFDYIINCIGLIKPRVDKLGHALTLKVNSVFPHELADFCRREGSKLIQITTDCVFSGARGKYTEEDEHDAVDLYGRSKSLGEPENCLTIRTSIIGEEQYNKLSLVEWAKSQKGLKVNGFSNHGWNGVTTKQYANICVEIIEKEMYREGIFHVFSPRDVSKFGLLHLIDEKFDLGLEIRSVVADPPVNRTLWTVKDLNSELTIPDLVEQIREM